jgi:hypothetical protein
MSSRTARGHSLALELDILGGDVPGDVQARRLVAQQFLDGDGYERTLVDEFLALIKVLGEHLAHPPNNRPVVSTPAPATTAKKIKSSSLVR